MKSWAMLAKQGSYQYYETHLWSASPGDPGSLVLRDIPKVPFLFPRYIWEWWGGLQNPGPVKTSEDITVVIEGYTNNLD